MCPHLDGICARLDGMCACLIVKVLLYGFCKKRCSHECLFSRITLAFSYLQAKEKEASKSRNAEKETLLKKMHHHVI